MSLTSQFAEKEKHRKQRRTGGRRDTTIWNYITENITDYDPKPALSNFQDILWKLKMISNDAYVTANLSGTMEQIWRHLSG